MMLPFFIFLILLLSGMVGVHLFLRKVVERFLKWERLHWTVQGTGLTLGGIRGLWWAGLVMLVLLATGLPYLSDSVQERSTLGPRLVEVSTTVLTEVADRYPGHVGRTLLIPQMKLKLPELPEELRRQDK